MSAPSPSRGGAAGMLLLFSVALAVAGFGFDFFVNGATRAFWFAAEPGMRGLIALGAVLVFIAVGHLMRLVLRRRGTGGELGGVDQS
jgi:hypothetical protein